MTKPFDGYEVDATMRAKQQAFTFDLEAALSSVVALEAQTAEDAFTAQSLGSERLGNGVVIGPNGLVLTMGYLVMEAERIRLTRNDGVGVPARLLGADPVTGLGLVQAEAPLGLPVLPLGDSRKLDDADGLVIAGAGGQSHAAAGRIVARVPFAGYWEYLLEDALLTEPAHPHWSGAALIGPAGDLVGVGSLSLQRQLRNGGISPMNMFVPAELLPPILDDLARGKPPHPPRPWLGVLAQDVGSQVVVIGVNPKGPAARAELRAGDIVLAVDGEQIEDLADFYTMLWAQGAPGALIPLKLERDGDVFDVEVRSMDRTSLLKAPGVG